MNLNILSIFQISTILLGPISILWIILIILLFLSCVLFLIKALKLEIKSQRNVYSGYGLFLLFFGFTRLLFFLDGYAIIVLWLVKMFILFWDICQELLD